MESANIEMDPAVSEEKSISERNVSSSEGVSKLIENRHITLKGLRQPGGWKTNNELIRIFDLCESFELKFIRPDPHKKFKTGTASCLFPTQKDAQIAYAILLDARIDGNPVEIVVGLSFTFAGEDYFKPAADEDLRARTIYAMNLATANKEILDTVLGEDSIVSVKFLPQEGDKQQAEIVMSSQEEATSARQDANVFDDEDPANAMKLLTPEEYINYVKESKERAKKPKEEVGQNGKENVSVKMAPEVEEEDIIGALNAQVEEDRLNWAELNELDELYAICDKVSANFNGLPDSILKPAMLGTLNRHFTETESHWLREHLQSLIQLWRRETESEVPYIRETQVMMKAPEYQPVLINRSRKRKMNTKAGRIMLGVGALLKSSKFSMRTENGEVEIDEDDSGNIMLNGETLSFDSWARVTRSTQPDVVAVQQQIPLQKQQNGKKEKKQREFLDFNDYKKFKKEQYEKRMGYKKMKIMDQHRKELEELERQEKEEQESVESLNVEEAPKPPKELDEGEIDSEEERQMEKKKKKNSSDSSSSSEESDDDKEEPANARGRRALQRKSKQRKMGSNPMNNPILNNLFDFRHQLVKQLPLDQKIQFARIFREAIETRGALTTDQYRQFTDDVARLSR